MIITPQSPQKERKLFGKTTYSLSLLLDIDGMSQKDIRVTSSQRIDATKIQADILAYENLIRASRSHLDTWRTADDGTYADRASQMLADWKAANITVRGL
jgi:hypothetical protein